MATRINTKFVLIAAGIVVAAGGTVGGLWVLQMRADTGRHIMAGDEFMAQGEYERALQQYGRAVRKEPAQLSHLHKVQETLGYIRPQTQDKANELDDMRLALLRHEVRYSSRDPQVHLRLIRELHRLARWFAQTSGPASPAPAAMDQPARACLHAK